MTFKLFFLLSQIACVHFINAQENYSFNDFKMSNNFNNEYDTESWIEISTLEEFLNIEDPRQIIGLIVKPDIHDTGGVAKHLSLEKFNNLQYLIFENSSVTELPKDLSKVKNLKVLKLVNLHKLKQIPVSIFNLEKLEVFEAHGINQLLEIPKEIGNLHELKELELTGLSKVKYIPEEIGQLKKLKKLKISGNVEIPATISALKEMEHLYIFNLSGKYNSSSIYSLKKLKHLYLTISDEAQLNGISSLQNLKYLSLRTNFLSKEIRLLKELKYLKISRNNSIELPKELSSLSSIEGLVLWTLPHINSGFEDLTKLTNLKNLAINDCSNLGQLPDLNGLKRLEYIQLYGNKKLKNIPRYINGVKVDLNRSPNRLRKHY